MVGVSPNGVISPGWGGGVAALGAESLVSDAIGSTIGMPAPANGCPARGAVDAVGVPGGGGGGVTGLAGGCGVELLLSIGTDAGRPDAVISGARRLSSDAAMASTGATIRTTTANFL